MKKKVYSIFVIVISSYFIIFLSNIGAIDARCEGLNIKFRNEELSVDVKDTNAKKVFEALEKKTKIKILNKKVIPDRKISIKFKNLKIEKGIKKLMHMCGIKSYIIIKKQDKLGKTKIEKLILGGVSVNSTKIKKEVEESKPEEAQREAIIKSIMPILEKVDKKTRQKIIREIKEEKVEPIED